VIDGFANYLISHFSYKPGVYSLQRTWNAIFGTGIWSRIPREFERTFLDGTDSLAIVPSGFA